VEEPGLEPGIPLRACVYDLIGGMSLEGCLGVEPNCL